MQLFCQCTALLFAVLCCAAGLLTKLLGPGGECEGYDLRIVGHSMGGAVASLTGLQVGIPYTCRHV